MNSTLFSNIEVSIMPISRSLNPINFRYIARITLKKPYAKVLAILVGKTNLPSLESQLNDNDYSG